MESVEASWMQRFCCMSCCIPALCLGMPCLLYMLNGIRQRRLSSCMNKSRSLDDRTFVSTFQACGMLAEKESDCLLDGQSIKVDSLGMGKALHVNAHRLGYALDVFVGSTLVRMYGKCGSIMDAKSVFDGLPEQDVVLHNAILAVVGTTLISMYGKYGSILDAQTVFNGRSHPSVVAWPAMLLAHVEQGEAEYALQLYKEMQRQGVSPYARTFVCTLQACSIQAGKDEAVVEGLSSKVNFLEEGKAIHAEIQGKGYNSDVFVGNSLVSMYGKCGSISDALRVFSESPKGDVISWNAMLAAYVKQCQAEQALCLYDQMHQEGVSLNDRIFVSAVQACGLLAELEADVVVAQQSIKVKSQQMVKMIHAHAQKNGYDSVVFVDNTLLGVYSNCGSIADAWNVFDGLLHRDVVSWNVLLVAYVEQGQADKSLQLDNVMLEEGSRPSDRTYVSMLWCKTECRIKCWFPSHYVAMLPHLFIQLQSLLSLADLNICPEQCSPCHHISLAQLI